MRICLNDEHYCAIQQSKSPAHIKGVAEMFKARRPVIGTKNGHHIKTGCGLCQVVLRQILHGDPADLELFSGGNGLGGMTEPIILSGFNLNKDKGLGNGSKS